MRAEPRNLLLALGVLVAVLGSQPAAAQILIQCPCDMNADGDCEDIKTNGPPAGRYDEPDLAATLGVQCMHLSGGDGFGTMADGRVQYLFSFSDLTGTPEEDAMTAGTLAAALPAPLIAVDQGMEFYLTMTNVGMLIRPDLFDPHTVHFHGFPNASSVFDGVPDASVSINMGASITYYYNLIEPGTFMYHCHVEATEHMQMGMLGNLYVRPIQNRLPDGTLLGSHTHSNPDDTLVPDDPLVGHKYVYNDGDGSTIYDVEYPIQLGGFDPEFHDASLLVQPLPFAMMWDRYPMLNGRGYPDTVNPNPLPAPAESGIESQVESSLITATAGDKILLRLSNLNITVNHNLISPSIPMTVVGIDSRELRSADGTTPLHYNANSVKLGGGMSADVILDTTGVVAGTYYLYAANLNYLSNYNEDFGGMMTEIVISP
jgi:FtsP/CotA-like multicopper oxidase with cupredoxin domain